MATDRPQQPRIPPGYTYKTLPDDIKINLWTAKEADYIRFPEWPPRVMGAGREIMSRIRAEQRAVRNSFIAIKANIPGSHTWKSRFRNFLAENVPLVRFLNPTRQRAFNQLKEEIEYELELEENLFFINVRTREGDVLREQYKTQQERIDALMERCMNFRI
jgi:hypothetical protein